MNKFKKECKPTGDGLTMNTTARPVLLKIGGVGGVAGAVAGSVQFWISDFIIISFTLMQS